MSTENLNPTPPTIHSHTFEYHVNFLTVIVGGTFWAHDNTFQDQPFIKYHDFEDHGQKMCSKNLYIDFKRVTMVFKSPVHHYIEAYLKTQKDLIFLKTRVPLARVTSTL